MKAVVAEVLKTLIDWGRGPVDPVSKGYLADVLFLLCVPLVQRSVYWLAERELWLEGIERKDWWVC